MTTLFSAVKTMAEVKPNSGMVILVPPATRSQLEATHVGRRDFPRLVALRDLRDYQ